MAKINTGSNAFFPEDAQVDGGWEMSGGDLDHH